MDIHSTVSRIKSEYKNYLRQMHPNWSDSSVTTHVSDAFYIWNNTISHSFWKCLEDDASMEFARQEIYAYLENEVKSDRAAQRTKTYFADLAMLKEFLDKNYGGVRSAVGTEYDCEKTIYQYAKLVYEMAISADEAVDALSREVPFYNATSYKMVLQVFACMMEGKRYSRRANTEVTVCFIEGIGRDFGVGFVKKALDSTYQSIIYYYEQTGTTSNSFRRACGKIAAKYGLRISFDYGMFEGITPKKAGENAVTIDAVSDNKTILTRYWLYAPGEGSSMWDEFYAQGEIGIGWGAIGDLRSFGSKEEMKQKMKETYDPALSYMNAAHATWQFSKEMKAGDVVFVKKGLHRIIGRGVVTGDYFYQETESEYPHRRKVNWTHRGDWEHPNGQAAMKTLTDITPYSDYVEKLCSLFVGETEENLDDQAIAFPEYTKDDFLKDVFMEEDAYLTLVNLVRTKKNVILQGAPGVGKTFAAKRLAYSMMGTQDQGRVMMVQFHQSYSYEDFIMGFRPSEKGFELKKGAFYNFCKKAEIDSENEYFFIIDEINRGNLSKIFGELFMLIENDKRGIPLQLLYSDEKFAVPGNVYLIGMMNTADRSLAMLDYALRRRFAFYEMQPGFETEGFDQYRMGLNNNKFNRLIDCVNSLNVVIKNDDSLGAGFCIGHSYFCNLKPETVTDSNLHAIVEYELIPLLQEYWFDEHQKVKDWSNKLRSTVK